VIYEERRGTITIVGADDTTTVGTVTEPMDGVLGGLFYSVPAMTGTGTATLLGTENFIGGTVYASTAADESTAGRIAPVGTPTPFSGTLVITATASGTQAANIDIPYVIHYETKQG
jgi:uncharacterized protein with beta-barrel porin domain